MVDPLTDGITMRLQTDQHLLHAHQTLLVIREVLIRHASVLGLQSLSAFRCQFLSEDYVLIFLLFFFQAVIAADLFLLFTRLMR